MYTEENIRKKIKELCKNAPYVHISVSLAKPHVELENVKVKIVGAYAHIFQIEEEKNGKPVRLSVQYGDIPAGIASIKELAL